jgi:hypothetical protein
LHWLQPKNIKELLSNERFKWFTSAIKAEYKNDPEMKQLVAQAKKSEDPLPYIQEIAKRIKEEGRWKKDYEMALKSLDKELGITSPKAKQIPEFAK